MSVNGRKRAVLMDQYGTYPDLSPEARNWAWINEAVVLCELSGVPADLDLGDLYARVQRESAWNPLARTPHKDPDREQCGLLQLTRLQYHRHRPYGAEAGEVFLPVENLAAGIAVLAGWRR